ncbi:MAG: TatD family hydrolase [Planctomycetaceae bacterium]|nr:TatD family hydrolase [Planctomycetaceae bacterium]
MSLDPPSPPALIDTHCHLDAEAFEQDLDEVLERAVEAGVDRILTVGITLETSQAASLLANRHSMISAVVGIQPNYVQEAGPDDWDRIVELARHPQVVAVGETGLDKYWDFSPLHLQEPMFHDHIRLSRDCGKPFIVHCREAEAEVLQVLRMQAEEGPLNGVMHSFCGTVETAAECIALGMHLSFAGMLTFRKNTALREVAATVPLNRLLVETDAPYLAPHPNRGKRNEPAWVRLTCECLAEVHGVTPEQMAAQTTANARRLFFQGPAPTH